MKVKEPNKSNFIQQKFFLPVCTAVFFVLYYFYVYLCIEPTLIYHGHTFKLKFPVFFLDVCFIKSFLVRPSGFVECLSAFLSQFFYFSWAGALVITLIGWFFYLATGPFIKSYTGRSFYLLRFVPVVALLAAYNHYIHCLEGSIKILLAMVFVLVYIKIAFRRCWMRWTFFLLLSVLLYYAAGTCGLLFAWFCCLYEIRQRRFFSSLWCLVSVSTACYVLANYLLDSNLSKLWLIFPEEQSLEAPIIAKVTIYSYLAFGLTAMAMTFLPQLQKVATKITKRNLSGKSKKKSSGQLVAKDRRSKMLFVIRWSLLFAVTAGGIFFTFDRMEKNRLRIYYYAHQRKWPELLRQARRIPAEDYGIFLAHQINRALLNTGRLGSEMFSYPQSPNAFEAIYEGNRHFAATEQFIEIGLVNDAAQMAYQSLEAYGSYPATLKQLAMINVLRGQTDAARIFLNVLSKDLIFGRWARDCLKRLETDPLLAKDTRISQIRSLVVTTEPQILTNILYMQMQRLLDYNGKNKMAYEYLVADHLLNRRLDDFVKHFQHLDNYGYRDIPRHYEEAILIYMQLNKKKVDLGNRKIRPETIRRFLDFVQMCETYKNDPQTAKKEMIKKGFSDTYYYYIFYGLVKSG